jgi:transcriptional regulator with XRE-family HTH domain
MNSNYLKKIMQNKNISIYKLSKLADLDDGMLNRIINGKTKNPRIDTLIKIAKALDLNEHEFAELCGYRKDDKDGI